MKSPGRNRPLVFRATLALLLGLLVSSTLLGLMLVQSDGTEPRGVCAFVSGDAGLLPLDPNEGGTYSYSCEPNAPLAVFYVLVPGTGLSVLFYFLAGLVMAGWRRVSEQRMHL